MKALMNRKILPKKHPKGRKFIRSHLTPKKKKLKRRDQSKKTNLNFSPKNQANLKENQNKKKPIKLQRRYKKNYKNKAMMTGKTSMKTHPKKSRNINLKKNQEARLYKSTMRISSI
jgi:hypothetical protein